MLLSQKNKNLLKLIVLISIFMLPLVTAHYLYYYGDITGGQTNQGTLISAPHNLSEFNLKPLSLPATTSDLWQDNRWHIIYIIPDKCQKMCTSVLHRLEQIHVALGKNTNRLQRVNIHTGNYTNNLDHWSTIYQKYQHMTMMTYNAPYNNSTLSQSLAQSSLYLADPLGNIILRYDISDNNFNDFHSKIFKDVKKLLNISKIG